MPKLSRMVRGRTRGSQWIVGAAFACFASFLACSGDGPVSVPDFDPSRSSVSVAPGPYVAGESYLATFTARNTDGEPFTAAVTVTLSLGGGGNGTFSAVVHDQDLFYNLVRWRPRTHVGTDETTYRGTR